MGKQKMIHIALNTEYSFKKCFLHMSDIHKYVIDGCVGIADLNSTYGHIPLSKEAEKHGFKPIFGVRLYVLPDESKQRTANLPWVFIAKDNNGLKVINKLVEKAFDNFYYVPKLTESNVVEMCSEGVYVISPMPHEITNLSAAGQGYFGKTVAIDNNNFPTPEDRPVYELLAGARKNGSGYSYHFEDCTYPQYIMSESEWVAEYGSLMPVAETYIIANDCNASIPKAEMVKWKGKKSIMDMLDLDKVHDWTDEYESRLGYELNLIKDKGYDDYFLIVADMINQAKKSMLVGPARGSSAGSLVCYLMGITEVDPIEHGLIFERFIDVNRFDLPDIDIDFPDHKRENVIKYLKHKYGKAKVMCLANISRLKPKSAIGEFAKGLGIPPYETDGVKDAIIERSGGDARAAMCIMDTFTTTEPGKEFIAKYPAMKLVERIENHASHAGKHAAGILVATEDLCTYGSLNNRDEVIMMDKKDAEWIGLLKIDCLGLRTLSILESVAEQLGKPYKFYNNLPLDDAKTYELFNSLRLSGVFQFEGQALQMIVKQMGVNDFNDISAITALARPGALNSGGTNRYIKYSTGEEEASYYSDAHRGITGDTFGIVVYQEQMMNIAREIGGLSWAHTSELRRAASKSLGDEFFAQYKDMFIEGALGKGYSPEDSSQLWDDISSSGSWSFNKSHAVSYGLISYWTAWCKANHPLEFAVASLNNSASPEAARKLLRDLTINDGIEYVAIDPDLSDFEWTTRKGKLIGGLMNIKGIGIQKARKIKAARKGGPPLTPSLFRALMKPETDFDILFPAKHYWGFLYTDPISHGLDTKVSLINSIEDKGEYVAIGCLVDRNIRDLNEHIFTSKRKDKEPITENPLYLNFKIEDDTDMISCQVNRYKYESIGRSVAESGKINHSWYLLRGKITSDWRRLDVSEIMCLNDYYPKVKVR